MPEIKDLLIEELQDLLHAENQLTKALPKMANAAQNAKLKECFEKHLRETEMQIERLNRAFELLGTKAKAKPCKGMEGIIAEGEERIAESREKDEGPADLALIGAAQKVEHYEISGYGTARNLARLLGEIEVARLLTHSLGEEERADWLLTQIAKPILQETSAEDAEEQGEELLEEEAELAAPKKGR